jgi:hypothetical protein
MHEREYSHRALNTAVHQLGWRPPNRPHAIMGVQCCAAAIIGLRAGRAPSPLQGARRIAHRLSTRGVVIQLSVTPATVTYPFSYTARFLNDDRAKR